MKKYPETLSDEVEIHSMDTWADDFVEQVVGDEIDHADVDERLELGQEVGEGDQSFGAVEQLLLHSFYRFRSLLHFSSNKEHVENYTK
jgi:hypothetical protein